MGEAGGGEGCVDLRLIRPVSPRDVPGSAECRLLSLEKPCLNWPFRPPTQGNASQRGLPKYRALNFLALSVVTLSLTL